MHQLQQNLSQRLNTVQPASRKKIARIILYTFQHLTFINNLRFSCILRCLLFEVSYERFPSWKKLFSELGHAGDFVWKWCDICCIHGKFSEPDEQMSFLVARQLGSHFFQELNWTSNSAFFICIKVSTSAFPGALCLFFWREEMWQEMMLTAKLLGNHNGQWRMLQRIHSWRKAGPWSSRRLIGHEIFVEIQKLVISICLETRSFRQVFDCQGQLVPQPSSNESVWLKSQALNFMHR